MYLVNSTQFCSDAIYIIWEFDLNQSMQPDIKVHRYVYDIKVMYSDLYTIWYYSMGGKLCIYTFKFDGDNKLYISHICGVVIDKVIVITITFTK